MVEQSTLLQMIQFVGLITPALAILIELLIRFHGGLETLQANRRIPIEIQILLFGFVSILFGGMGVGLQMISKLDDQLTQFAALLIFGGLPFLAVSVLVMSVRISVESPTNVGFINKMQSYIKYSISIGIPLIISPVVYFGCVYWLREPINSQFDWWIFANELKPAWYFYIAAAVISYDIIFSMWKYEYIPSDYIPGVVETWIDASLTDIIVFIMFFTPSFGLYYILQSSEIRFITSHSIISSVPYIFTSFSILIIFIITIDPKTDADLTQR